MLIDSLVNSVDSTEISITRLTPRRLFIFWVVRQLGSFLVQSDDDALCFT